MANVNILISSPDATNDHVSRIKQATDNPKREINELMTYLGGVEGGSRHAKLDVQIEGSGATYASGTLTLGTVVAGNTATVNGVTFTAVASNPTAVQFLVGGTPAATAANLAAAINASSNAALVGVVTASSSANVVTVSAYVLGPIGNLVPLAGGTNIVASGAVLSGGTYAANVYNFGM